MVIFPYGFRGSAIQSASSKNSTLISPRPASGLHKSPTNPAKQTLWTCVTPPQTPSQPCQANVQNLRHSLHKPIPNRFKQITRLQSPQTRRRPVPANHMRYLYSKSHANQVTQILQTCDWGRRHLLHAHICTCGHGHPRARPMSCAHGQGHTFTGMCIPSRAYLHGHGAQANPPRPASGATDYQPILPNRCPGPAFPVHADPRIQPACSNILKLRNGSRGSTIQPAYSKALGGMGVDDAATPATSGGASTFV